MIFIKSSEECKKMSFKEFQSKALSTVRQKNHMNLVEDWEDHITFREFDKGDYDTYYATIHYADSIKMEKEFKLCIYDFSYFNHKDYSQFSCVEGNLYKEEIQAITALTNCFNRNKDIFFHSILTDYQKEIMSLKEKDSDGDGLSNYDEKYVHGTDPYAVDTDGDGIPDGDEVTLGTDPLKTDASERKSIAKNIGEAKQKQGEAITSQHQGKESMVEFSR